MNTWHSKPSILIPIVVITAWICTAISLVGARIRICAEQGWDGRMEGAGRGLHTRCLRCRIPQESDSPSRSPGPAHLRGGALQQHRVQGDGGEHARLAGAGLGLHDEICKERPRGSGQPPACARPRARPARSPSPQRPSGMAFSCTGDGRWKPAASSPASTGADSRRDPKSEGPPGTSTSRVRNRPGASLGAAILAEREGKSRERCPDPAPGLQRGRRQGAPGGGKWRRLRLSAGRGGRGAGRPCCALPAWGQTGCALPARVLGMAPNHRAQTAPNSPCAPGRCPKAP